MQSLWSLGKMTIYYSSKIFNSTQTGLELWLYWNCPCLIVICLVTVHKWARINSNYYYPCIQIIVWSNHLQMSKDFACFKNITLTKSLCTVIRVEVSHMRFVSCNVILMSEHRHADQYTWTPSGIVARVSQGPVPIKRPSFPSWLLNQIMGVVVLNVLPEGG